MLKSLNYLSWMLILSTVILLSCDKVDVLSDEVLDTYVDESMYALEKDANSGHFGCFEFIFPISIEFPGTDGIVYTVNSYEELRSTLRRWKESHPRTDRKPSLVFPVEILTEDGAIISIGSFGDLRDIATDCANDRFDRLDPRGHRDRPHFCFKLTFPLTIEFPDGSTATVNNRLELKQAVREWYANNPPIDVRPHLTFPFTVELADGSLVLIENRIQLQRLKESCRD